MPLPSKPEIEVAAINLMLGSNEACIRLVTEITEDMFTTVSHRTIVKVVSNIIEQGNTVDYTSISTELSRLQTGVDLTNFSPDVIYTEGKVSNIIRIIKETYLLRTRIQICDKISKTGSSTSDIQKFLKESSQLFWTSTATSNRELGIVSSGNLANIRREIMLERMRTVPILTGWEELDNYLSGGGFSKGTISIIAGRPSHGKCQKFNTPVFTTRGYEQIKNIKIGDEILSLSSNNQLVFNKVKSVISNGIKPLFKLKIKSYGYELFLTDNHPCLTISGWKELKDLSPGDRIAGPRRLFIRDTASEYSPDFCRLIGYLIGDGGLTHDIHFTTGNPYIEKDIENILIQKYKGQVSLKTRRIRPNFKQFSLSKPIPNKLPNPLLNDLRKLGLSGKGSHTKFIPPELITNIENIRNLLISLWETDGSVYGYSSVSLKLIRDVQNLLLYFGILTTFNIKKTSWGPKGMDKIDKKRSFSYRLHLSDQESIINFWNEIGNYLTDSSKKESLRKLKDEILRSNPYTSLNNVPKEVWGIIKKYISVKEIFKGTGRNSRGNVSRATSEGVSQFYLFRIIELIKEKIGYRPVDLVILQKRDITWLKIESITLDEPGEVYDLEVENNHNFIANNVIVHNSLTKANLIYNLCERGIGVCNVAVEQTLGTEMDRIDTLLTGILIKDLKNVRNWNVGDSRINLVKEAQIRMDEHWNYHIIHKRSLTLNDVYLRLQQIQTQKPIQVVFFDLFDKLIDVNVDKNKPQTVGKKLGEAAIIAENLGIHLCLLVQINREVERRKDKRPTLSDLKDSGSYEEVARLVMLLYRDSYYNPDNLNDIMELIIAKQNDGPSNIRLEFSINPEIGRVDLLSSTAHFY